MKIRNIALDQLVPSPANVRRTGGSTGIDELVASIEAHGLLQNLQVREAKGGKFEVVAGGRRLAALRLLAKRKHLPKSEPIPCHVLDDEDAGEISLAENVVRLPMHPADQYEAFKAMANAGKGPEEIAARFGCTPAVVKQRLKLASVSPRLIEAYRAGELTLDQLMAFTISDDHAAQEAAWFEQPAWNRKPSDIRRTLTAAHVDADDPRAQFIGIDAYAKAGGMVLRDLFDDEHEGYLTDIALLDRLVAEKLEAEAAKLRAEGWLWVEIAADGDYRRFYSLDGIEGEEVPLPKKQRRERDKLAAEYDALVEEHGDDPPEEIAERIVALSERIDALSTPELRWRKEDIARSGVVVGIDHAGRLDIMRGLLRSDAEPENSGEGEDGNVVPLRKEPKLLSDELVKDLTAHRTAAVRTVLAGNAGIALTAVVHALALPLHALP